MAVVGRENWQYQDSISKYVLMRYAQVLIRYFSCKKYRPLLQFLKNCYECLMEPPLLAPPRNLLFGKS